jgi:Family of unknown function (DUF6058)
MNALDTYFSQYFFNLNQFSSACHIQPERLLQLIHLGLIPEPSYVVRNFIVSSFVMGVMPAPEAASGDFFHRLSTGWVQRALSAVEIFGEANAARELRRQFRVNATEALAQKNASFFRLTDAFDNENKTIEAGLNRRLDSLWEHFLKGTFGLCVAEPISEAAIVHKEIVQEKLTALTNNGARTDFSGTEKIQVMNLIESYAAAAMPFSPIDYPKSSRKRLVDDLRVKLSAK